MKRPDGGSLFLRVVWNVSHANHCGPIVNAIRLRQTCAGLRKDVRVLDLERMTCDWQTKAMKKAASGFGFFRLPMPSVPTASGGNYPPSTTPVGEEASQRSTVAFGG